MYIRVYYIFAFEVIMDDFGSVKLIMWRSLANTWINFKRSNKRLQFGKKDQNQNKYSFALVENVKISIFILYFTFFNHNLVLSNQFMKSKSTSQNNLQCFYTVYKHDVWFVFCFQNTSDQLWISWIDLWVVRRCRSQLRRSPLILRPRRAIR